MRKWLAIFGIAALATLALLFWGDADILGHPRTQMLARDLPERIGAPT